MHLCSLRKENGKVGEFLESAIVDEEEEVDKDEGTDEQQTSVDRIEENSQCSCDLQCNSPALVLCTTQKQNQSVCMTDRQSF